MYKIKNIIDATAKAYYLAYCALIREHNELCSVFNHSFSVYVFPAITTAAFSCEIALKNLIYSETGREVKGHNLNNLKYEEELEELSKIFIALTLGFRYATISPTIKVKWNASIGMEVRLKCYAVSLF